MRLLFMRESNAHQARDPEEDRDATVKKNPKPTKQRRVTVVEGTAEVYDPVKHAGEATEDISKSTLYKRKPVKVLKGTAVVFKPAEHGDDAKTEKISRDTLYKRQPVKVLKGTAVVFNPAEHGDDAKTEEIPQHTWFMRKPVRVLRETAVVFKPEEHGDDAETEEILRTTFFRRKSKKRRQESTVSGKQKGNSDSSISDSSFFKRSKPVVKTEMNPSFHPLQEESIREAVLILRGDGQARHNCPYLSAGLMHFFQTGEMPVGPVSSQPATLQTSPNYVVFEETRIKHEAEAGEQETLSLRQITQSTALVTERGPYSQIPAPLVYVRDAQGRIDVEHPFLDLTAQNHPRKSASFRVITETLQEEARFNGGIVYGTVAFGPTELYRDVEGHEIAFYATAEKVVYIEPQDINKGKGEALFYDLTERYEFASTAPAGNIKSHTYSDSCFYIIYGAAQVEAATTQAKLR